MGKTEIAQRKLSVRMTAISGENGIQGRFHKKAGNRLETFDLTEERN